MIQQYLPSESIATLVARLMLGILFFTQGYEKFFIIKINNVINTLKPAYKKLNFPDVLIAFTAYSTSFIELIGGLLLIIGLFRFEAYYFLGADLLIVSLGFSLLTALWDMQYVMPRLLLLLLLLLLPPEYDRYSLDHFLRAWL